MTWHDIIWYDRIYDMILYDMIWYMMWSDTIWYDTIWYMIRYMMWYDMIRCDTIYDMIQYDMIYDVIWYIRRWVHKFPAWHTKTAPNAKCSEGYIEPSIVRLLCQFQVATCSSMLEALVLVRRVVVSCWNVERRVPCCNQIPHQRGACTSCY